MVGVTTHVATLAEGSRRVSSSTGRASRVTFADGDDLTIQFTRSDPEARALSAADQDAGQEHQEAADRHLKRRPEERRVHEFEADPRDRPKLDEHDHG